MRGEIWAFSTLRGEQRPLLVIQDDALADAPTVIGLVVTTRPQRVGPPLAVRVETTASGLDRPAWVKVTQLHTVPAADARGRLGALSPQAMHAVDDALRDVLALGSRPAPPRSPSAPQDA